MRVLGKATTRANMTYQSLRSAILSGELPAGSRVRTNQLSSQLCISLGAVREALSQLSAEGLVLAQAHRGYTVSPLSVEDLTDLTRVRMEIENLCLTWAIAAGTLEWESNIIAATHRLSNTARMENESKSAPSEQWAAAHDAYHTALVSACGSIRLLQIRRALYEQSERYRRLEVTLPRSRDPDDEHRHIAEATIARDGTKANELMRDHITRTTNNILKAMNQQGGGTRVRAADRTKKRRRAIAA